MNNFWLNNICKVDLFSKSKDIKYNSISLLVFVVFILLDTFNSDYSYSFLVISLIIIFVMYNKKNKMTEYYEHPRILNTKKNVHRVQKIPQQLSQDYLIVEYNQGDNQTNNQKQQKRDVGRVNNPKRGSEITYHLDENDNAILDVPTSDRFSYKKEVLYDVDNPEFKTQNSFFKAKVNPRTLIAPVIAPPSHDISYWKANNLITHSAVNTQKQIDDYSSGYMVKDDCKTKEMGGYYFQNKDDKYESGKKEEYIPPACDRGGHNYFDSINYVNVSDASGGSAIDFTSYRSNDVNQKRMNQQMQKPLKKVVENFESANYPYSIITPEPTDMPYDIPTDMPYDIPTDMPYDIPTDSSYIDETTHNELSGDAPTTSKNDINEKFNEFGFLNINCGYDKDNVSKYGLPSNFPASKCQKNGKFKNYNENMFTEIVQPGVFTRSEIDEPINANIGRSFQQQFPPTTVNVNNKTGEVFYTKHDPKLFDTSILDEIKNRNKEERDNEVNTANVYDPRFYGYGTDYRAYTDNLLGQPRFFYDDINSVRMPNYISRSNIDFAKYADSYGTMNDASGNPNHANIRKMANDEFLNSAIEFRTGMQERLMRKKNAEKWQQRQFPLNTNSSRGISGGPGIQ